MKNNNKIKANQKKSEEDKTKEGKDKDKDKETEDKDKEKDNKEAGDKDKDNKDKKEEGEKKDEVGEKKEGGNGDAKKDDINKSFNSQEDKSNDENKATNNQEENKNFKFQEITINFDLKGDEFEDTFKATEKVSKLFSFLNEKLNKFAEYDLLTVGDDVGDGVSLLSKKESYIGNIFPNSDKGELTILYLGLEISDNMRKEYEVATSLLGVPLFDLGGSVGLLIFHKFERSFTSELIEGNKLQKFGHLSSFCNCKNMLFLSGGEGGKSESGGGGKDKCIADNIEIDLFNTKTINDLPPLSEPRSWHTMMYVPSKYIFIVGGNTKNVEIYDIDKKTISSDSEMREIRNECTLCCMNDSFLYAFSGSGQDGSFLDTVEKCNLRKNKRKWEKVNYKSSDGAKFQECYYVSSYFSETTLILFGTNEGEKNHFDNILFDTEDMENCCMSKYESKDKIKDVCPEKTFHSLNDNSWVLIPLIGSTVKIYHIDSNMHLTEEFFPDALKKIMD